MSAKTVSVAAHLPENVISPMKDIYAVTSKDPKFTLSTAQSFKIWASRETVDDAQKQVLSCLPFYPDNNDSRVTETLHVDIGNGEYINEFYIKNNKNVEPKHHLVVIHGYGAALGLFIRNFDALSSVPDWDVHAIDLLGCGASSRPKFDIKSEDKYQQVTEAEDFFLDSIEKWRIARKIDKFTLLGHSLGGYLGTVYSLQHADIIEELILASPVGVPHNPYESDPVEDPELGQDVYTNVEEEVLQPQSSATSHHSGSVLQKEKARTASMRRKLPWWVVYIWEKHFSPFAFIRNAGPLGPKLAFQWASRRFSELCEPLRSDMHRYVYRAFSAKGSGEYCLSYILAPGAFARKPLIDRLSNLKCRSIWLYGENDWMEDEAGKIAVEILESHGQSAEWAIIDAAGHHLYLDNPKDFNAIVIKEMKEISRRDK